MKVEPFSDEKSDGLLDIKLEKSEDETFTTTSTTGNADYLEERSLHTILKFGMIKEEKQDNYDGGIQKTENIFVQEKSEHPDDLIENDIISKFSDNNDDDLDSSNYNNMDVKMKTEFQEEIESVLQSTSDMKTSVNMCSESQCLGYHVIKQEDHYAEVIKSTNPDSGICGETTLNGNKLNKFIIPQCNSKTYSFVVSGKKFGTMDNLTQEKRIQSVEKPYHCAVYGKRFESNSPLKQHVVNHNGENPYSCGVCRKQFVSNSNLKIHRRIHTGEIPYSCTVCEKQFKTNSKLKSHLRIHTKEKPYNCTVCQKQFGTSGYLKLHQRIHTGEKPYSCTVCFKTIGELKKHQRIHTGEKPYSCTVCEKQFGTRDSLKKHQRIHTGEKPFSCTVCKKQFVSSSYLKVHQRIHTGENPYSCTVCEK
ncbi:zinc finger protein 271-like, partial [Limulus polyphemus]|uniref:Zinc finger protein 271-like n=1 Tax=Limulus polyphemus TaxID=6850 RepID=A0ABM1SUC6_LIMPO